MANTWATFGLDLHLDLAGTRVRAGLEGALRDAVQTGRLRPGTRLPSSRTLAKDLGIARNTVADAYGQLVAEGWLVARQGSGTQVAERSAAAGSPPAAPAAAERQPRYDLVPGSPDLSAFPRAAWLTAARRALNAAPNEALGYADPRGRPELREALADYLARTRGVRVTADRLVVCAGFTQGLSLLCRVLAASGRATLAIEEFGHLSHREVVVAGGVNLTTLPVDAHGAAVSELTDADAVLLTPAHQFPLGVALSAQRRIRAVQWALDTDGLIIEDDYDGEFRYDRQPLGAMQALAPEHVVYAGTASKSLAPGVRLGWLVLPAHLVDEVVAAKEVADRQCSALDQLTLAEFIAGGSYDQHVRRSRLSYRRRRDRMVAALRRDAPWAKITGIAAGLHALVELDRQVEASVVARAVRHDLAVEGLGAYTTSSEEHWRSALVVGYGTPPEHMFSGAIARLCAVLKE
jgi:GntR family transcriptional regulator / MocR family aminotransferase